jgi:O-antigen/teichoic acid export membrane protein
LKDFLYDIFGGTILKVANTVLLFLVSVFMARWLDPEAFGHYTFAVSCITLVLIPVQLGMPGLLVREISKAERQGEWGKIRGAVRVGWWGVGGLSILVSAVAFAFLVADRSMDPTRRGALMIGILLIPLTGFNQIRQSVLQGFKRVVAGQVPEMVVIPSVLLLMVVALKGALAPSAESAIAMRVVATLLALIVGVAIFRSQRPVLLKSHEAEYSLREWFGALLPFSLLAALGSVKGQLDIFLLGVLAPPDQLGMYRVATAIAGLVVFAQTAFNAALGPRLASLHAMSDLRGLEQLARRSSRLVLVLTLPPALVMIFAGKQVLSLVYGENYVLAALPLAILCVGQVINGAVGSVALILNMTGFERYTLRTSVFMLVVSTILMVWLVPMAGVIGAAVAASVSTVLWNVLLLYQVRKRAGINPLVFSKAYHHG